MNLNVAGLIYGAEQAALKRLDDSVYAPELNISMNEADVVLITLSDSNGEHVDDETMKHWLDVVLTHLNGPVSDNQLESVWNEGNIEDDYAEFPVEFER